MRNKFLVRLWGPFLGTLNKWRFRFRIWLRVRWLFFKRWWRLNFRLSGIFRLLTRSSLLLIIGLGLPLLAAWLLSVPLSLKGVNKAGFTLDGHIEWRAIAQPLILFVGLPAAFILWAFRDANARANLENQRKDINLKEFQEIQLRAAGALDEKLPGKARETLQIAAIHQLRPFLCGEYGESFRRPAWELLRARLETSEQECGLAAIREWTKTGAPLDGDPKGSERGEAIRKEIANALRKSRPSPVTLAERTLLHEEASRLFRPNDLPLTGGHYGGADLRGKLMAKANFQRSSFIGAKLQKAHLEAANLMRAHLEAANLSWAHLEAAELSWAHLEGANLRRAHLEAANLSWAHLEDANLRRAHLENTDLQNAHLEGANLRRAHLENTDLQNAHLEGADLRLAHLEGADLADAHLEGADLEDAHLEGAELHWAHLEGANLFGAHLEGAELSWAHLEGADLRLAHLEGANLKEAHLEGAVLKDAHLEGAILSGIRYNDKTDFTDAIYDDDTCFANLPYKWKQFSEEEKAELRAPFTERGMVHIDDVKKGG